MAGTIQCGRRSRKDFGKIPSIVEIPNLIEVQKRSYETFLQKDVPADRREDIGLQAVFKSVFPIADYNDNALLEFDSYHFGDPKYTVEECHDRGMTFAIPLKVTLRLVVFDHDKEAKTRTVREQRGQEVYLGELPLMTDKGTFIINGTERVVVSQLQRSAGVFFDDDKGKTLTSGKPLYSARVIPYRGSWVEFDFDASEILHVRVDRRRKMHATAFLRAFWFLEKSTPNRQEILSDEEILGLFYDSEDVLGFEEGNAWVRFSPDAHESVKVAEDVKPPRHREPLVTAGKTLNAKLIEKLVEANVEKIAVRAESLVGGEPPRASSTPRAARCLSRRTPRSTLRYCRRSWAAGWRRSNYSCPCFPACRRSSRLTRGSTSPSTRRWRVTTSRTPTRRSSRSTVSCGRAIPPPWSRPAPCSGACSWTRDATISRASGGS